MFGLPSSTEVNRRVAKEKLYANAILTPQLQDMIKSQIETVIWRNKLADSTMGIGSGESIKEIEIFEVQLRQQGLDKRILYAIARAIPYKILFVLTFNNEGQVWIEASGTFYNTGWLPIEGLAFRFEGLNLDAMYEDLARQVVAGRLGMAGNIDAAVERDKQRRKLERDIAALERKVLQEKQFNRQVKLNGELKRLKGGMGGVDLIKTIKFNVLGNCERSDYLVEFAEKYAMKNFSSYGILNIFKGEY